MKKYRFIGNPDEYGQITVIKLIQNHTYKESQLLYKDVGLTVKYYAEMYPEDWEEVTDKDVERQEILDAVNKPLKSNIRLSNELADQLVEERIEAIKHSLSVKAKEYVRNDDRMHNFNIASQKSGQTREKCLAGFRLKHEVSVEDIRNDIELGKLPTEEVVREKYGDIINYYILEEMSIIHKIRNAN